MLAGHNRQRSAAAQREVVLVAAMLATLALIALPGLTETRERARKARCLSNLKTLAAAAHAYASEDSRELLVPLHQSYASTMNYNGWSGQFQRMDGGAYGQAEGSFRVAIPHSFGGRTATVPFGSSNVLLNPDGFWGGRTKPLNRYVDVTRESAAAEDTGSFECPADVGYANRPIHNAAPRQIADIPLIDVAGNSYRNTFAGLFWAGAGLGNNGMFSVSAVGHSRSSLQQMDRLTLFTDAPYYSMARWVLDEGESPEIGWHGDAFADQASFCDGSARMNSPVQYREWSTAVLQEMSYTDPNGGLDDSWFLRKGSTWTIDAFPTPGARIAVRNPAGAIVTPRLEIAIPANARTRWPFVNYQNVE